MGTHTQVEIECNVMLCIHKQISLQVSGNNRNGFETEFLSYNVI